MNFQFGKGKLLSPVSNHLKMLGSVIKLHCCHSYPRGGSVKLLALSFLLD
jgi:hypothetical protein